MIWLTWRQYRAQFAVVLGVLVAIAIALIVTGPHLVGLYDTTVANCARHGDCTTAMAAFLKKDSLLQDLGDVVLVMPALVGIFWGAPLVAREIENSTNKLAWTQSVSRTRWLATKLGLLGLASVIAAGLLSLMVTWWSSPFDRVTGTPFSPSFFDRRDLVPIGYAAFAFALGVVAGMLIRRTLPAMAATMVAFIAARFAEFEWVRPHLMAPLRIVSKFATYAGPGSSPSGGSPINRADWVISDLTINRAGHVIGQNGGIGSNFNVSANGALTMVGVGRCPNKLPPPKIGSGGGPFGGLPSERAAQAFQTCADKLGLKEALTYQPINRYWPFQVYETAIFVGLALVLAGFCLWWVRRRVL
jgi:hypothetical protein